MSALLDEARSVLSAFREHVASWTNSGMLVTIDRHLDELAAAAADGVQRADEAVKNVLGELYGALHGSTGPDVPAPVQAPVAEAAIPVDAPVVVGESGPEIDVPVGDTTAPSTIG